METKSESKPAPAVQILYLKTVTAPDFKAGEKGASRSIERHWAEQLVAEGYAQFITAESEVANANIDSGPDSTS